MPRPNEDTIMTAALPEYLAFQIMVNVRELKKMHPEHWLVKAIEQAATDDARDLEAECRQLSFKF